MDCGRDQRDTPLPAPVASVEAFRQIRCWQIANIPDYLPVTIPLITIGFEVSHRSKGSFKTIH